jgi:hypothetical protein
LLAEDNSGVSITPQLHCNLRTFGGYAAFKFSATCEKTCLFIQHLLFLQGLGDLKKRKDALEILRPLLRRYVMKSNLAPLRIFPKKT